MLTKWTCPHCQTLLGIRNGDQLEIRYKAAMYVVEAMKRITAICRKCGKRVVTV
jgi:RNase P subunit RPR2